MSACNTGAFVIVIVSLIFVGLGFTNKPKDKEP